MKNAATNAVKDFFGPPLLVLLAVCCGASLVSGQSTFDLRKSDDKSPTTLTVSASDQSFVPSSIKGTVHIEGPWHFHTGDDPRWADPQFDDSAWEVIKPGTALIEQGFEPYSGYGWYRLRLRPVPVPESGQVALALLVVPHSVGQLDVFLNGNESAHTLGMTDRPQLYQSAPFSTQITHTAPDGTVVIAIRSWANVSITHGLLDRVEVGDPESTAERLVLEKSRQWDQHVLADLIASFLFFGVAALAGTLFLAQRHHSEYLWLTLLCVSVALRGTVQSAFALGDLSLSVFDILEPWTDWLFIPVTLEFVLRFTGNNYRKVVRGYQLASILLPLTAAFQLEQTNKVLSVASQVLFCGLIVFLLFRSWRRGRNEAGVMLIPFFLAATMDSSDIVLDFAASRLWIPARFASHRYHLGPIEYTTSTATYLVFLGSLIAVILYRFIRVSQEEQKSTAEIEAARSVQALLIPTQLPSNQNFMLEGAYLPANGVGGDFFQVLPLKDDSLLVVVGDVSGKGLRAAMNASTLVGALRNELSHDPATVLNHLNQVMLGATSATSANAVAGFATCLCARIHPDGRMVIANAGHLNPYRDGRELELAADLPLGIVAHIEYEQASFLLKPGDRVIFLSDGVVEATNPQGELFGFERTQQVSHESARYISQTAQRFGQNDDITVVSVYFVAGSLRAEREALHAM